MQIPIIRRGGASLTGSSSSSSGSLNFTIVNGTMQPENPVENTIWINTDQTIGEWTFSIDQPSAAQDGDLWISTQNSSAIAFDALEENNLMIYPLDAY